MIFYFILFIPVKLYLRFFTLMILLNVNKMAAWDYTATVKHTIACFTMSDLRACLFLPKCFKIQQKTLL